MLTMKSTTLALTLATVTLVAGCASTHVKESLIKIERIDSSTATISQAHIQETEEGLKLRGEVKRKSHAHGGIPGHLHVELVDSQGNILQTADIQHTKKPNSDHVNIFEATLPQLKQSLGVVRITHHDMKSPSSESFEPTWQESEK